MRVTFGANAWSFVFDFGRPITLLSPINMPGTHQYAVTLVAQIVAQVWRLFWRSLLVDKVSWYMRFFLILPNKYYTFVTSPFLPAGPLPAPFCSIFKVHKCLTRCLRCGSVLLSDYDTILCLPLRRTHQKTYPKPIKMVSPGVFQAAL